MKYKVTLPKGVEKKIVGHSLGTTILVNGVIYDETSEIVKSYPKFFTSITEDAKVVETPKEELLTETPREVEVEIVVEDTPEEIDFESMTVKELKAYASDNGIEITKTKKKDIIAEIKG